MPTRINGLKNTNHDLFRADVRLEKPRGHRKRFISRRGGGLPLDFLRPARFRGNSSTYLVELDSQFWATRERSVDDVACNISGTVAVLFTATVLVEGVIYFNA